MTNEQVLGLLESYKKERIKERKFPFHIMMLDFYKKHGRKNVVEGLQYLVRNQIIECGRTCNDYYFNVELPDDCQEKEIEIDILRKCRFIK